MTHSYIAYKREDELRVGRIVAALEQHGLDIWWDRELPGGEAWRANLTERLDTAGCVVVIWSRASAGEGRQGHFVREEAQRGLDRDILVAVTIDDVRPPLGFGEIQAIDLRHWKGKANDGFLLDLVEAIRAKLEGRPAPPPIGPRIRVRRLLQRTALSGIGAATLMTFAFNAFGVASHLCAMPGPQPGLSDGCGAIGLGGRPNREERLAWSSLKPGSCEALREHIRRFPGGAYRAQAADLLQARKLATGESWTPAKRELPLFSSPPGLSASQAEARAAALRQAETDAERLCRGFATGTLFRFKAARAIARTVSCSGGGGASCSFDGIAQCDLEVRGQTQSETCLHR